MLYCTCETPIIDVEHDAGCRRCGLPVDFTPRQNEPVVADPTSWQRVANAGRRFA